MIIAFALQELQNCINQLYKEADESPTLDGSIASCEAANLVVEVRKAIITKSMAEKD